MGESGMSSSAEINGQRAASGVDDGARRPLYQRLYLQVLVAMAAGAVLGWLYPDLASSLKPLSDAFIKAIRAIIQPIIFATVVVGIATMGNLRQFAKIGAKALIYFEVVSTLALLIGVAIGNLYHFGAGINADPASLNTKLVAGYVENAKSLTLVDFLLNIVPDSFIGAFTRGDILPVLFLAVLFGLALCQLGERAKPLVNLLDITVHGLFGVVRIIMYFAPLAALGAIAFTIGKYGIGTLLQLGQLVAGVYIVSILFVIIVLGGALRLAGFGLWPVLAYFKDEILFVFCATSAETMIPRAMVKLEKLGCSKEVVGLVIPAGFSFNMDGTAIYMTMAVLFIAQATNIDLSWVQQLTILFVMLFTSKGAAGVTGGGFIALAATMPAISVLPIGGLALLVGIDRFMAEIRAATNLTSNVIATLVIARWAGAVDMATAARALNGEVENAQPALTSAAQ
jgi:aerobic C4-dicarboxylate transport protein